MKNETFDYEPNNASQSDFAIRFTQSHYNERDWPEYANDEKPRIECIARWLGTINAQNIFVSRLHVIHPRLYDTNDIDDRMFIIEFHCPRTIYLDNLLEHDWLSNDDFRDGIYNVECPGELFTCGTDSFKLIVQPTY